MIANQLLEYESLMDLQKNKLTGSFFTPAKVGKRLARDIVARYFSSRQSILKLSICDPFCGDGRLIVWLIEELVNQKIKPVLEIDVWDLNQDYVDKAKKRIQQVSLKNGFNISINAQALDTFLYSNSTSKKFDIVITNPPWFILKPDIRHMNNLSQEEKKSYKNHIRDYSKLISKLYSNSVSNNSWAGWNVNFARVGVEVSLSLISKNGFCGIISPESLLADTRSKLLRKWILQNYSIRMITHYPAETRLFNEVDQNFITLIASNHQKASRTTFVSFTKTLETINDFETILKETFLTNLDFRIPVNYSKSQLEILQKLMKASDFANLQKYTDSKIWSGRELDETRYKEKLSDNGTIPLLKGKDIKKGNLNYENSGRIDLAKCNKEFESMNYARLIWRDISRPSQKRRIQATIIPPGPMIGNSLNVLHNYSHQIDSLFSTYGIISSLPFEFQTRALLATNHVSLGSIKLCKIPKYNPVIDTKLKKLIEKYFKGDKVAEYEYNALVARSYGLTYEEYCSIVFSFQKFSEDEKSKYCSKDVWLKMKVSK